MDKIQGKRKIYSFEEVQSMIENKGYVIIKDTFKHYSKKFLVKDKEGYYFYMNGDNIRENKQPDIFSRRNPFTIKNIHNYIKINNITSKLISEVYDGNNKKMVWECECGETFERSWANFRNGFILCSKCSSRYMGEKHRLPLERIYLRIDEMGYKLLGNIENVPITSILFSISDSKGYLYEVNWRDFNSGKKPLRFHRNNPYSIQNINNFFKRELNDEFECIDAEYIDNTSLLKFKHKKCGCEFFASWASMLDLKENPILAYCKCPECNTHKIESHHASALKQVFLHEYPDTVVEERSCINFETGRALPTDIVNHRLKIAVEVQSSLHDDYSHKLRDEFKKNFWLNKGYEFYDPDIRDYSILEMIQLFFPDIGDIPDYVDFNFSNCIDFNKVQNLLNKGLTIKEISKILNLNENSIRYLSVIGKIKLPENYKEKVFNMRPIVRLSKTGEFIKKYNSLYALKKDGFADGTIRRVLNGTQNFSYDSFWLYEDDYVNGNYTLPKIKNDKFLTSVEKYDMGDNYVCSYNTIYEAENDSISSKSEIYRVACGKRKSSRNEKWKFSNK